MVLHEPVDFWDLQFSFEIFLYNGSNDDYAIVREGSTFNSLLRSSDVYLFDTEVTAVKPADAFNSLLRSSGCFGFIWVFKFCGLF